MLKNLSKKKDILKEIQPVSNKENLFLPDRVTEREDHVVIENTLTRFLVVDMLPEQLHFGWFSAITSIPRVAVSVTIHPYSYEQASNRISKQQTALGAELIQAEKDGNTRRIDVLNLKYSFYRQLLTEINLRRTNIVSLTVVIAVSASTIEELNARVAKIQDILGSTKAVTMYLHQIEGLRNILPGVQSLNEYHDVTIANAACVSPLISTNVSHPSGIYFGLNETGSPCFLNLFIGEPYLYGPHMYITGMTRSGKSYTIKGLIARSRALGRKVVVLDPEGEYKNIAEALGGAYVRFHSSMKPSFNPFDIEPTYEKDIGWFLDIPGKADDIVSLLGVMLEAQSAEKLTSEERALASRAVRIEYESLGIYDKDPESIYKPGGYATEDGVVVGKTYKEMPTFSSFRECISKLGGNRLANILSDYCVGGPLGFFDGQTIEKLQDKHFVVFDMSSLNNEFAKMYAMQVMLTWLWDKYVRSDKTIEKHLIVDEAWLFMQYQYSAVFLSQIARRGAKHNTSLIAASQSFREFLTQEGLTFLNQCDTKFFLKMQKADAESLMELFGLSRDLVDRLITFEKGRGVLRTGNESAVIQFKGFQFEEQFLRSDPGAVLMR